MKKITESQLKERVNRLKEYMAEMGGGGAAQAQRNANVPAPGTAAAVRSGQPSSGKPAAPAPAAKPAAPAPAPKVAYEKDFPAATAMELQKKLNAAGEKLTVDGKMGPATRAAMARHPEITSQSPESQAISADLRTANNPGSVTAPPAPAPAAAPATTGGVQDFRDGSNLITDKDGNTMATNSDGTVYIPGSNPNLPQNKGLWNTIKNAATGQGDFQNSATTSPWVKNTAPAAAQATPVTPQNGPAMKEATTFQNDELSRLVSLVQYR
jgi:hypothetical protein